MSGRAENGAAARAWVVGVGHSLPDRVVTNADLPASLGCHPADIAKKTGILERRWVHGRVYTSDLGAAAGMAACKDAGMSLDEVDCIIAATQTPDYVIPGLGVLIQRKLGIKGIPCFDIRNNCSGFIYALHMARSFVLSKMYRRILLVAAELQSHGLGRTPLHAHTTPLFGDGAGAIVVADQPIGSKRSYSIAWSVVHADGDGAERLRQRVWDISLERFLDIEQLDEPEDIVRYGEMDGEHVFRKAVKYMSRITLDGLKAVGLSISELDFLLPHQANASISRTVAAVLGLPREKLLSNISTVGNTSAASIPILLSQSAEQGLFAPGRRIACVVFGAGYTWGGALLEVE